MYTPFRGLLVVDLSTVLAGPSVGTFFAELGARVIKVENRRSGGDVTRHWRTSAEHPTAGVSAYFASVNFGKAYRWLDLSETADAHDLRTLLQEADILLTNFKDGDDEKFGLSWDLLHPEFPRLIHGRITGFTSDPSRVAYDVVLQAETGFMGMNGTAGSGPVKMPVALIDVLAAHQLKEGLLCALLERTATGIGCRISVSLEEAALASLVNQASNYLMTGHIPGRIGSLHPNIAPYGEHFVTQDQELIVLAVGSDQQFMQLCALLGLPHIAGDDRFHTNVRRVVHRAELAGLLGPAFLSEPAAVWLERFASARIPAGLIRRMDEVLRQPHVQSLVLEEEYEGQLTRRMKSVVFRRDQ